MAEQPGMAQQRLHTSWHTDHHSSCSSSFALQRHPLRYDTGIESREQLGQVGSVHGKLMTERMLRGTTEGRAAGQDPAATPDQLGHSASLVLLI